MVVALIALGTNLGEKLLNLENGIKSLAKGVGIVLETSRLYRTAPQYVADQPAFFNCVVKVETQLSPSRLLEQLKQIEVDIGRVPTIRYGPRLIDLDVLFYGDQVVQTETSQGPLLIPHERVQEREFVLAPLRDVSPSLVHPTLHQSVDQLYQTLMASTPSSVQVILPISHANCWTLGAKTYLMGILNVTTDSFSGDGALQNVAMDPKDHMDQLVATAMEMHAKGADIIDIGGESTRPGAKEISLQEELARVVPLVRGIRVKSASVAISIDTTKAQVAREAIAAGANIVNDVSGGLKDPQMLATVAELGVPIVLMHMRGTPETMTTLKTYKDVVEEVTMALQERVDAAKAAGVFTWNILVDPGIGFAKDRELNLQLLRKLSVVKKRCGSLPLLIGTSRKGFIGQICDRPSAADRVWGTAATVSASVAQQADIVRVHDVMEMHDVVAMSDAIWRSDSSE